VSEHLADDGLAGTCRGGDDGVAVLIVEIENPLLNRV
jgi:hypothetical protein